MMKLSTILIGFAMIVVAATASGQTPSPTPQSSPTSAEAKRTFKHSETIEDKYDRFKDSTTVSVTMQLMGVKTNGLAMLLSDSYAGQGANRKPPTGNVLLSFVSAGDESHYKLFHSLIFLADDERIRMGDGVFIDLPLSYRVVESVTFGLPRDTLRKLASAKKIEFQLGPTEFTFSDSQLEAIRDFESRLNP